MKFDKQKFRMVFTIFVFVALASLDCAVIGLFPPLFSSIASDLKIHIASLGVVSAINMAVTSFSSLFWGYMADRGNRKRLIIIGTIIWSISVFLTAYSRSFLELVIYQVFTGIGLGCISSIGFSVMTDYIPKRMRGMLMSLWGLSQGFGGIAGSIMASIIAPTTSWRRPFEVLAILGISFIFLYFFIKEPKKGAAEPELREMVMEGAEYDYKIEYSHIKQMLLKKSNKWLLLQGFFLSLTTGTLIWLPTLYMSKINLLGVDPKTSIILSGYLFGLLQVGGLASIYFGYLGDKLQKLTHKSRPIIGAAAVALAMPLYMLMFSVPLKSLSIADTTNPFIILAGLFQELVTNPWLFLMFVLAVLATAAQSANSPNWLALITDVNLPEHRATFFSIANLVNGIARSIGNALIGFVLVFVTMFTGEPNNYVITMVAFQIFLIPSAYCYIKISRNNARDVHHVKKTLKERAMKFLNNK